MSAAVGEDASPAPAPEAAAEPQPEGAAQVPVPELLKAKAVRRLAHRSRYWLPTWTRST